MQVGEAFLERNTGTICRFLEDINIDDLAPTLFPIMTLNRCLSFICVRILYISEALACLVRVDLKLARLNVSKSTEGFVDLGLSHVLWDVSDDNVRIGISNVVSLTVDNQLLSLEVKVVHFSEA